ncbi:unnamed protein product [Somion occarium]|uniref:SHSP domain-containing protein n=1 Tax=Somion occarium TaxID=3059160 RepID=A0ABP1DFW0_9APHY
MPLQRRPPSPPSHAQSSLSPSSSRPSLSTSSSGSSSGNSSVDTAFRHLTLNERRPLPYGFKEDGDIPDLQELYAQDRVVYTEEGMLQRKDSWDARTRETSDSPRQVPLPFMPSRVPERSSSSHPSHALPPVSSSSSQDGEQPRRPVLVLRSDTCHPFDPTHHIDNNASSEGYSNSMTAGSASSSAFPSSSDLKPSSTPAPYYMDTSEDSSAAPTQFSAPSPQRSQRATTGPIHPFSRPFSSPDASGSGIFSPRPIRAAEIPDRTSTASLPLPMHTPYHTLPLLSGPTITEDRELDSQAMDISSSASAAFDSNSHAGPSRGWGININTNTNRSPSPHHSPRQSARSPPNWSADWTQFTDSVLRSSSPPHAHAQSHPHSHHPYAGFSRSMSPSSSHTSHTDISYPPPAPPTILTPPPPPERDPSAPHVPFLSHGTLSREIYIAVETLAREYRLHVWLPGYRRDAITLSTRKRRILHLVADSWEPEGGHFERRIAFGYDADLSQVRAEFDGESLRVIVPRRVTPMTYWSSARD